MTFRKIVFLAVWLLSGSVTFGQTADKKTLTLDGAERVIAAARAKAQEVKSPGGVIAVVDAGGNLMALARLDGTFAAGDRKSTRLNSSHGYISYAVFCLKK